MYAIYEREKENFKCIKFNLDDWKAVLKYLSLRHKKVNEINEEETKIIYYETETELNDIN